MAIELEEIRELAQWALSKSCNGWREDRLCLDQETMAPLEEPHPGCVRAQKAHDLLSQVGRYEGADVFGWLVNDSALSGDLWD